MKKYTMSIIGLSISTLIWLSSLIFNIDYFEFIIESLDMIQSIEKYELDEIILCFMITLPFLVINIVTNHKSKKLLDKYKLDIEKNNIYKAMLASNHHIINNFLNEMLIFQVTAEETEGFDKDVMDLYDTIINDAKNQLDALGSIKTIDPETIYESVRPKE